MTRKKKYKNGLSITPFIVNKDAGDVETGINNFNSMMSTGNGQAMGETFNPKIEKDNITKGDLKENKMKYKYLHEDLDNVSAVEEKSREVVDPAFASAVRKIRSHDKARASARKLRKAPKEGEESLPKDLKMTLEESLFEDISVKKPLKEGLGDGDVQVYMNTWANYNENGADLSKYGINSIKDGWMSIDDAREFAEKYAEDEPFINDVETPLGRLGIDEYSNVEESLDLLEKISEYDDYDLEVIGAIYEDQGGDIKDSIEIFDSGDYEYYSGVNDLTDLAYELIDQLGGIKYAVSNPEYYIDEDALRRDLSFDVRDMMYDEAKDYVKDQHKYDDEEEYDLDQEIEDYIDENEDDYLDNLVDEILDDLDDKTIENYFDYEAFGRDLGYDGYYIADKGAIRIL